MRSLITGVGGFVGQHLLGHLLRQGDEVYGVARHEVRWRDGGPPAEGPFTLLRADLAVRDEAARVIEQAAPEHIYHLAGMSSVSDSFADPVATLANNIGAQINVLEAVRAAAPATRTLIVSSAEIYGRASSNMPLDEDAPLRPENPYAVSKASQDLLAYQYGIAYGLDVVRVRPFNHIGPGQSERFAASSFGRQIAEIESGVREPVINVGNLESMRDFTDVRDIVRAYELALLSGERGAAYNLGTGVGVSIQGLLDRFVARSRVAVRIERAQDRVRPSDAPFLACDGTRFYARTHWKPTIPLDKSVEDILTYWRAELTR